MPMIEEDFVRDCWYVVGWSSDFSEGVIESRRIIDEPVVFYRKQDGRLAAFADRCIHRHAPLSLGRLEGDDIRCMYHGLRFDLDGLCVEIPGQASIPKGLVCGPIPSRKREAGPGYGWAIRRRPMLRLFRRFADLTIRNGRCDQACSIMMRLMS